MEKWLADPQLLEADADAEYAAVIDIDLADIKEPILCAPNDPDDARLLSDVQGEKIDEVFIGSCMTNIGHFRAAGKLLDSHKGQLPTRLWVAPPTRMDAAQLTEEGYYSVFGKSGARIEIPGCSLCMGNQARVADGATVVSTSTRNFPEPFEVPALTSIWPLPNWQRWLRCSANCRRRKSTRPSWRRWIRRRKIPTVI
ncbi:hypothetical protein LNO88_03975 [Klebsiella pneumoniae subsp. pneumoniae]|nr:hypothetical protein [Klebsiella pneumoniae subsp. pneumoniae]